MIHSIKHFLAGKGNFIIFVQAEAIQNLSWTCYSLHPGVQLFRQFLEKTIFLKRSKSRYFQKNKGVGFQAYIKLTSLNSGRYSEATNVYFSTTRWRLPQFLKTIFTLYLNMYNTKFSVRYSNKSKMYGIGVTFHWN